MVRTAVLGVAVAIGLLVAGCGETVEPRRVPKEAGAGPAARAAQTGQAGAAAASAQKGQSAGEGAGDAGEAQPVSEVFAVGDAVRMGDLVVTVNSVRTSGGGDFLKPEPGHVFLLVDITVENRGTQAAHVSSLAQFALYDAEGYQQDMSIFTDTRGQVDGEIPPGRKIRGEIAWEVPRGARGLELAFDASLFGSGQARWAIGDVK